MRLTASCAATLGRALAKRGSHPQGPTTPMRNKAASAGLGSKQRDARKARKNLWRPLMGVCGGGGEEWDGGEGESGGEDWVTAGEREERTEEIEDWSWNRKKRFVGYKVREKWGWREVDEDGSLLGVLSGFSFHISHKEVKTPCCRRILRFTGSRNYKNEVEKELIWKVLLPWKWRIRTKVSELILVLIKDSKPSTATGIKL